MSISANILLTERTVYKVPVTELDETQEKEAEIRFKDAAGKGIIKGELNGNEWLVTDEIRSTTVRFDIDSFKLEKACRDAGIEKKILLKRLKTFALLWLGKCDIFSFRNLIHGAITEMIETTIGTKPRRPLISSSMAKRYYCEWVLIAGIFPEEYMEFCKRELDAIRMLDAEAHRNNRLAADIPDFTTFLKFGRILREFRKEASEDDKRKYYPIFLMWDLMTILPLRVREFCVTPYDCLRTVGGKYYLTVRRTKLKGNNVVKIHEYFLEDDYQLYEYEIPEWLFKEFSEFLKLTKDYAHPNSLLMSNDFSHAAFGRRLNNKDSAFLDRDISYILKKFYDEIIAEKFEMSIVGRGERDEAMSVDAYDTFLKEDEIMPIMIKHLRHIAVINMILSGCNITAVRDFCGHSEDLMTWNYYENASKTVALATRYYYDISRKEKRKRNMNEDKIKFLPDNSASGPVHVTGGICRSEKMRSGDCSDCMAMGVDCKGCPYFFPEKPYNTETREEEFDAEVRYLRKLLFDRSLAADMDELAAHLLTTQAHGRNLAAMYWANLTENELKEDLNGEKS